MRLLFINRYFWPDESATAQLLSDLAFFLADRGHEITVITGRTGYRDSATRYPPEETHRGVRILRGGGRGHGRAAMLSKVQDFLSFFLCNTLTIRKASRSADWIITLTDPPMLGTYTNLVAHPRPRRATWCMDIFPEIASLHSPNPLIRIPGSLLRKIRNRTFHGNDALVVLGKDMARHLVSQSIPEGNVHIIHNWAIQNETPASESREAPTAEALKKSLSLNDRFTVGYSGNLGRVHEVDTVARAIQALPEDWDGQFLFLAAGRNLELLRSKLGNPLPPWIHFHKPQPQKHLAAALKIPDVHWFSLFPHFSRLVFPSKFAGILAAGRPCIFIGDSQSEIARLIRETRCGLAVTPGDVEGFLDAMDTLKSDPARCRSMGRAARELYSSRFDRGPALKSWENLLRVDPS